MSRTQPPNWHQPALSEQLSDWLYCPSSLSNKLRQVFGKLEVKHLLTYPPLQDSAVREAALLVAGLPLILARTDFYDVAPQSSHYHQLLSLGDSSLGDFMFAQAECQRGQLQLASGDFQQCFKNESAQRQLKRQHCWARRSVFTLTDMSLRVMEVFLPDFWRELP